MRIELPYPPTVNHYYTVARGRKILSATGRAYKKTASGLAAFAMRGQAFAGDVSMTVLLNPPDRRRRDIDNGLKALVDSLKEGGVMADDSQIKRLEVVMGQPIRGGCAVVYVEAIGG